VLTRGERYSHVFRDAGAFPYHDANQATKRGTVVVTQGRGVTIDANARVITFNGYVTLSGSVSNGRAGEQVVIRQKPQGSDIFLRVTTVSTTDNGLWRVRVRPRRNTQYEAVWRNIHSPTQAILVKPLVRLKQSGGQRFVLAVHAQTPFRSRTAVIQRWVAKRHRWVPLKSVRLTVFRSGATAWSSNAVFRLRVRHGTIIRGFVARNQVMPAYYGPAWSHALRA
jgi:hypothetical protein